MRFLHSSSSSSSSCSSSSSFFCTAAAAAAASSYRYTEEYSMKVHQRGCYFHLFSLPLRLRLNSSSSRIIPVLQPQQGHSSKSAAGCRSSSSNTRTSSNTSNDSSSNSSSSSHICSASSILHIPAGEALQREYRNAASACGGKRKKANSSTLRGSSRNLSMCSASSCSPARGIRFKSKENVLQGIRSKERREVCCSNLLTRLAANARWHGSSNGILTHTYIDSERWGRRNRLFTTSLCVKRRDVAGGGETEVLGEKVLDCCSSRCCPFSSCTSSCCTFTSANQRSVVSSKRSSSNHSSTSHNGNSHSSDSHSSRNRRSTSDSSGGLGSTDRSSSSGHSSSSSQSSRSSQGTGSHSSSIVKQRSGPRAAAAGSKTCSSRVGSGGSLPGSETRGAKAAKEGESRNDGEEGADETQETAFLPLGKVCVERNLCSRREAEHFAALGLICVDGKPLPLTTENDGVRRKRKSLSSHNNNDGVESCPHRRGRRRFPLFFVKSDADVQLLPRAQRVMNSRLTVLLHKPLHYLSCATERKQLELSGKRSSTARILQTSSFSMNIAAGGDALQKIIAFSHRRRVDRRHGSPYVVSQRDGTQRRVIAATAVSKNACEEEKDALLKRLLCSRQLLTAERRWNGEDLREDASWYYLHSCSSSSTSSGSRVNKGDDKKPSQLLNPGACSKMGCAGRLDKDSSGLVVFTQDGRIASLLVGGGGVCVGKEYLVEVDLPISASALELLRSGVLALDGRDLLPANISLLPPYCSSLFPDDLNPKFETNFLSSLPRPPSLVTDSRAAVAVPQWSQEAPAHLQDKEKQKQPAGRGHDKALTGNTTLMAIELFEGRHRQIRRMCELVGLRVLRLHRIRIGKISIGRLPVGHWRLLLPSERFV